jgi:hypothetical protein
MEGKIDQELTRFYGEFLVRFEFVCSRIRFLILYIVYPQYDNKQRNYIEILAEGLTADPLRRKMVALAIEKYSKESSIYKSAQKISKIFSDLVELRNSFAHGTIFIGQYDFIEETRDGTISLRHPKIKKDGLDLNFKTFDADRMKKIIKVLFALEKALASLTIIVKHPDRKPEWYSKYHQMIDKELDEIDKKAILQN